MIRKSSTRRPVEFSLCVVCNHAKPLDAVGVGVIDVERIECCDRSRSETIAADLVAPITRLVEHHHSGTATSGLHRGGGSCWPGTDHEKICFLHTSIVP